MVQKKTRYFLFALLLCTELAAQRGFLAFQYFRVDRQQWGGNTDLQLNDDFEYLHLFKKGQRFAPDEPSSFSSLELGFWDKTTPQQVRYCLSAGIFRNHIKGDFLLRDGNKVHFSLGNSQVGISATGRVVSPAFLWQKITLSGSLQLGIGPQFTKFTTYNGTTNPAAWGIRGWGLASNAGIWGSSPPLFKRLLLDAGVAYHLSASRYGDFDVKNVTNGDLRYEKIHFSNHSRLPRFTIGLRYLVGGQPSQR